MNIPIQQPSTDPPALSEREEKLIATLRLLVRIAPSAWDEIERFLWTLVERDHKWSYDDPASMQLALEFMALDPFLKRESDAITKDFASTLGDGLEHLPW